MASNELAIDVLARNVVEIVSRHRFRSQKIQVMYSCGFELLGNVRPVWRDDWNTLVVECIDKGGMDMYRRYVRELVTARDLKSHRLN